MFENKHKIAVQPMYSCGCLLWLLEISRNNVTPGIVWTDQQHNIDYLSNKEWDTFFSVTNDILIGVNAKNFRNINFHKWLLNYKPKYLEIYNGLVPDSHLYIGNQKIDSSVLSLLKKIKTKIYIKNINTDTDQYSNDIINIVDALNVKNNRAAGHTSTQSLQESIEWAKSKYQKPVIASGGLASKEDITEAFNYGADAVMIGTLFAVAKESNLSEKAKHLLISKTSKDIKKFGVNNQSALGQGQIIADDNGNMEKNLHNLAVCGQDGIIFAGHGVDKIKTEMNIEEIVSQLIN